MYTDTQLKQALAKMLPENTRYAGGLLWQNGAARKYEREVLDTELLHLCWLVEESLDKEDMLMFCVEMDMMFDLKAIHATWQHRTIALCKVKGIEIV